MVLDLDRFRLVNDSWGYSRGTEFLDAVAQRVRRAASAGDTCAHLGGDEYALMVSGCGDAATACQVAEGVHRTLAAPFQIDGHQVFLSVSIGIALSTECHETPEDCLRAADAAICIATKALGTGITSCSTDSSRDRAQIGTPSSTTSVVPSPDTSFGCTISRSSTLGPALS